MNLMFQLNTIKTTVLLMRKLEMLDIRNQFYELLLNYFEKSTNSFIVTRSSKSHFNFIPKNWENKQQLNVEMQEKWTNNVCWLQFEFITSETSVDFCLVVGPTLDEELRKKAIDIINGMSIFDENVHVSKKHARMKFHFEITDYFNIEINQLEQPFINIYLQHALKTLNTNLETINNTVVDNLKAY